MRRSPPPKATVMLGLAALAVELPFCGTCVLVQLLKQCPHCRHEWLSWPILAGSFPWYFATISLKLIPRELTNVQVRFGWGLLTACFIILIFALSQRSTLWRVPLAVGLIASSGLAILTFLLIAA